MQEDKQALTSLSVNLSEREAPDRAHGEEAAAWVMQRHPGVTVRYLPVPGKAGKLCFSARDEDELWAAALGWMARGPEALLLLQESGAKRWLRRAYASFSAAIISVFGTG